MSKSKTDIKSFFIKNTKRTYVYVYTFAAISIISQIKIYQEQIPFNNISFVVLLLFAIFSTKTINQVDEENQEIAEDFLSSQASDEEVEEIQKLIKRRFNAVMQYIIFSALGLSTFITVLIYEN